MLLTKDTYFYKRFFTLTLCIAAQNLIVFSVNLADNIMLGSYSETALSGSALANQVQFFLQMLITGIGEGTIVLATQYWGKRELNPVKKIFSISFLMALFVGTALWVIMFFATPQVLGLLTSDADVLKEGVRYVKIICFSYVFFSLTTSLVTSLRSVELVRIGFVLPVSTLIINISLNYLLIYGNLGAPRLGVQGAAIATLTSRIVELVILIVYLKLVDSRLHLKIKELFRPEKAMFQDYLRVAAPVILSNGLWGFAMAIQSGILGRLGASAIAANSIATTLFQILTVVSYGTSSASSILIGKTVGEEKFDLVKEYARTIQIMVLIIGLLTGGCLYLIKDQILAFYTISQQTREMALQFISVLSVTVCGTAYEVAALVGIVRGGGDTKFVLYNDLIFMWLIVLPSAAIAAFVFDLPPVVVFCCLKSDQILKCFVAVVKVNRYTWIKKLTRTGA